jgi:arabinose-5-phosphate isomerase
MTTLSVSSATTASLAASHSGRSVPPALASIGRTLDITAAGFAELKAQIEEGPLGHALERAVDLMRGRKGRIIVSGVGKSGLIGRKLAATFASTGTPAYFVHATEASHGDLGMVTEDDLVLALSWSGETTELADLLTYASRFNVPLVAMTAGAQSSLAKHATVALILPLIAEACPNGLAPTTSTALQLVIGDALAIALLEAKGFSAQDFRVFHPGGKLGAKLSYVRDLMHAGSEMPLVKSGILMSDALIEMSAKRFGITGILDLEGLLAGVITDGDLRRHMADGLLGRNVDAVMSRHPKTIPPDALAASALELMEESKITVLFVVEHQKPVGILHLHDLLRGGVA